MCIVVGYDHHDEFQSARNYICKQSEIACNWIELFVIVRDSFPLKRLYRWMDCIQSVCQLWGTGEAVLMSPFSNAHFMKNIRFACIHQV